jgi:phosphatidylethanolamine/phosphatidyl-N-methylethanolamine N-methyltransferase
MTMVRDRLLARARALADDTNLKFFREWLKDPLRVAAVSPSSRELAAKMLAQLPANARRIIELGGGTGAITEAILAHGVAPQDLLVLELGEELHAHLSRRFPDARIVMGDAREVAAIARRTGFLDDGPVDAVISGLGLLAMPKATQRAILKGAFETLGPHGRFIQFTYGPVVPVAAEVLAELDLSSRRAGFTLRNIPPATVYTITRSRSKRIPATRAGR